MYKVYEYMNKILTESHLKLHLMHHVNIDEIEETNLAVEVWRLQFNTRTVNHN